MWQEPKERLSSAVKSPAGGSLKRGSKCRLNEAVRSKQGRSTASASLQPVMSAWMSTESSAGASGAEQRGNAIRCEHVVDGDRDAERTRWAGDLAERCVELFRRDLVEDELRGAGPETAPPAREEARVGCGAGAAEACEDLEQEVVGEGADVVGAGAAGCFDGEAPRGSNRDPTAICGTRRTHPARPSPSRSGGGGGGGTLDAHVVSGDGRWFLDFLDAMIVN